MPRQGIRVLREQTRKFIAENPVTVVLTHHAKEPDGAGGYTWSTAGATTVTGRIIPRATAMDTERRTSTGEVVRPDTTLLCSFDADVRIDDTYQWKGMTVEVVWVNDMGYEKVAEVVVR